MGWGRFHRSNLHPIRQHSWLLVGSSSTRRKHGFRQLTEWACWLPSLALLSSESRSSRTSLLRQWLQTNRQSTSRHRLCYQSRSRRHLCQRWFGCQHLPRTWFQQFLEIPRLREQWLHQPLRHRRRHHKSLQRGQQILWASILRSS